MIYTENFGYLFRLVDKGTMLYMVNPVDNLLRIMLREFMGMGVICLKRKQLQR